MRGAIKQAVVLCAGRGSRLGRTTARIPKAMLPIGGRPFITHTVERLQAAGFCDIILVVGYLGGQLREHFVREKGVRFVTQVDPIGTADALLSAASLLERRFFVTYGDLWFSREDCTRIRELSEQDGRQRIATNKTERPRGAAVYTEQDRVSRIVEKPVWPGVPDTVWNASGLYVLHESILECCHGIERSCRNEFELTSAIQRSIDHGKDFAPFSLTSPHIDIGVRERYEVLCAFWNEVSSTL